MSKNYPIESLLRPILEFPVALIGISIAGIIITWHNVFLLSLETAFVIAIFLFLSSYYRFHQGCKIYRYQKGLIKLPYYSLLPKQIPVNKHYLFLGRGFEWNQSHTQRVEDTKHAKNKEYLTPSVMFKAIRKAEKTSPFLYKLFHTEKPSAPDKKTKIKKRVNILFKQLHHNLNVYKPLPPVGGNPVLHAVGMLEGEKDIYESLNERVGHKIVLGTTRVGKTRLAEIFITQDIQRGDTTVVFDPKGDADLMLKTYTEAKRTGRPVYIFHLGFPEISCRYNAIGSFTKITEVAGRISDQLPAEGNASSFKDFAWGFINIVAKALVKTGDKPDFVKIRRYINDIDPLIKQYKSKVLLTEYPDIEATLSMLSEKFLTDKDGKPKFPPGGKDKECFLVHLWQKEYNINDPELEGILAVFRYDNAYYSKLVASLRPLLDKLTSGDVSELLSPSDDNKDKRPIIDWTQIMRQKAVVYVGLDALSDSTVAHAVGAAMFADLTSIAGKFYKFGTAHGLPNKEDAPKNTLSIHADEFNEVIGDQFIPMLNKAGGAGYQVTAYTQSGSDTEVGIGSKPKANVVLDNFNTMVMLRVKSEETANLLITKVPEYEVNQLTIMAQATDSANPKDDVAFTSAVREQITSQRVPAVNTNDMLNLPKGQAFAMIEGGQLYKLRLPLAGKETFSKKSKIPNQLSEMAGQMKQSYSSVMDLVDINTPIANAKIADLSLS